ncbi:fibulin-7-like [Arapaima gigas]
MKMMWIYVAMVIVYQYVIDTCGQAEVDNRPSVNSKGCSSMQELQDALRQVHKLLSAHEASYLEGLRSLRKKLTLLQKAASRQADKLPEGTCPLLQAPPNGRKLGQARGAGHEVHFVCEPGYELVGSQTRVCLQSLSWSGQQPRCQNVDECASVPCLNGGTCVERANKFICLCPKSWTGSTCQMPVLTFFSAVINTSSTASSQSPFIHPATCTEVQGITRCSCEPGFSITRQGSHLCTDIDECSLFHMGQAGRLCLHTCVNTPGGYRCACPEGYNLARNGRSCRDVDECADRQHNCTQEQLCVNTFGGFQCVRIDCPRIRNATYVKTSPTRCERFPCPIEDKGCSTAPNSLTYHSLSVVSKVSVPLLLFRISTARLLGDTLRFSLLGAHGRHHFTVQRLNKQTGELLLTRTVQGPATLEVDIEMSEMERGSTLGRYITKFTLFVSQYEF